VANGAEEGIVLDSTPELVTIPNYVAPALPGTPTRSASTIAQKKFLYTAIGDTTQLFAWSISNSGLLSGLSGSPYSAPYSAGFPISAQSISPIITNSAGTFLYIGDAANSQIHVFSIDSTTGLLTEISSSPFSTGAVQPWNLAMDGAGKFLYVNQGNASGEGVSMEVMAINSSTGALSSPTAMGFNMYQVAGETTGKFMFGVTGETGFAPGGALDQHVYIFSINQASGVLTQVGTVSTTYGPIGLVVHPNGKYVYEFSISLITAAFAPMEGFQFDGTTGTLTPLGGSPFSSLTNPYQGFFDQSGAFMFVHASGQIGVFNVDSKTGLPTEPVGPYGGTGNLAWAITDAP
jgi:6-phosphogluconolactonase (cycloisomerase 2 family)